VIPIEEPGESPPRDLKRHLARGGFHRLEVDLVRRTRADQTLDFGGDLRRDLSPEPLF